MDLFPLWNSLRVAAIATCLTFMFGIWAANGITRLPAWLKGALNTVLTLPLVLPPTVVGFFLLKTISPKAAIGAFFLSTFFYNFSTYARGSTQENCAAAPKKGPGGACQDMHPAISSQAPCLLSAPDGA